MRRFLLAHHSPLPKAAAGRLPVFYGSWGELHEKTQLQAIQWFVDNKIPIDVFWIDAGWYGDKPFQEGSTDANSEWWKYTGSWRPNKITYPRGLKPIGAELRRHNLGFLLWIEAERVFRGTDLQREHPEWLLGPQGDNFLVNLGNPAARQGDHGDRVVAESARAIWPGTARTSTPIRRSSGALPTRPTASA